MPSSDQAEVTTDSQLNKRLCPEQHDDLVDQAGPMVYCNDCGHTYRYADLLKRAET